MKKFALLAVYVNRGEGMVFFESTDRHFIKQVSEDDRHMVDSSGVGPNRVRVRVRPSMDVKVWRPFDAYEYCCDRGWEPFQQVLNGEILFRKEVEEEDND